MDDFHDLIGKKSPVTNFEKEDKLAEKEKPLLDELENGKYHDPLDDKEKDGGHCQRGYNNNLPDHKKIKATKSNGKRRSQSVDKPDPLEIIKKSCIELFIDQIGEPYASIKANGHIVVIPISSNKFRDWIIKAHYDYQKEKNKSEEMENENKSIAILANEEAAKIQTIIKLDAQAQHNERKLEVRVAGNIDSDPSANDEDNEIYYDLCNKNGEIVKVTMHGWKIIKHGCPTTEGNDSPSKTTIVFKRYDNQLQQASPSKDYRADILSEFLSLTNLPVEDKENRILAEVYIVSLFLPPEIPKPILISSGEQGSAKSTFQELVKSTVDPCGALTLSFPKKIEEMIQQLSHNHVALYDNVSDIPPWISDVLCRAVTGSGFSKRTLYTDDDDFIYRFRRCVGFNGINVAATKPDLLERGLILRHEPIPKEKRRKLKQLWNEYESIKPELLGFIFDVLVKVLNRIKEVQLTELPRMADWAEIGEVISRCLGHKDGAFLEAYNNNMAKQNEHALEASQVATAMIKFMEKRMDEGLKVSECIEGVCYFQGTMTELRKELNQLAASELEVNTHDKEKWPQSSQALGNKLNEAATNLRQIGIIIERPENKKNHCKDVILIKQNEPDGELESDHQNSSPYSIPLQNDQNHAQIGQKRESGKLGNIAVSVAVKKREIESNSNQSPTLQVSETFPSSPSPRLSENHAQITSDIDGKQNGNTKGPTSCFPLYSSSRNSNFSCIDEFFYDDPNERYRPLPEHTLEQSPCYTIIGKKGNFYYCKLHPEEKNIYLETIEHHIKYKERDIHKSEILKAMSNR